MMKLGVESKGREVQTFFLSLTTKWIQCVISTEHNKKCVRGELGPTHGDLRHG